MEEEKEYAKRIVGKYFSCFNDKKQFIEIKDAKVYATLSIENTINEIKCYHYFTASAKRIEFLQQVVKEIKLLSYGFIRIKN